MNPDICPPCVRGQHEHCYNIQLADAGPAGHVCECPHPEQLVRKDGTPADFGEDLSACHWVTLPLPPAS